MRVWVSRDYYDRMEEALSKAYARVGVTEACDGGRVSINVKPMRVWVSRITRRRKHTNGRVKPMRVWVSHSRKMGKKVILKRL